MRSLFKAKTVFFVLALSVLLFAFVTIHDYRLQLQKSAIDHDQLLELLSKVNNITLDKEDSSVNEVVQKDDNEPAEKNDMKYILQWTSPRGVPFAYMGKGQEGFTSRNCPYTNCIVTSDKNYLGDVRKFDVIAFNGPEVRFYQTSRLPTSRSPHQKYVFATIESSHYYPVCNDIFNNYFNWTWTFRLDSEVRWGYMLIKDKNNIKIGPSKVMHWMKLEDMDPVSEEFKEKLKTKKKAAAWFASNCFDKANRKTVANNLKRELEKYNLELDVYGKCGSLKCPSSTIEDCEKMLKDDYYFYLSFENSFSEDYVTEKLTKALHNNVVPVVYGGANYTRFMPDGIYLNAKETSAEELAAKMDELIKNPEQYAEYFKWQNHYSYHSLHDDPETDEYCRFCAILNDEEKVKKISYIEDFKKWWNSPSYC